MTIYIRVKEIRVEKGWTQEGLARALDMTLAGYQSIEYQKNKSIPYETLEKLCEVLECEPGDLLERRQIKTDDKLR